MVATVRRYLFFIFLSTLSMIAPISTTWFERDEDAGYWFDTVLQDYDPAKGTAEFNCSLRLFRRNTRPATMYLQMGLVSTNDTIHAQSGDGDSSEMIRSGVTYSGNKLKSEAGQRHLCQIELGDGTRDKREIQVNSLDGAPIVYVESSKYPEMAEVPYGASFYIIYTYLGEDVKGTVFFSSCDPREAGCEEGYAGQNYEESPFRFIGGNARKIFSRGKAVKAGFYTFKGTSNKGDATAYFQLKIADPVPATWSEKSAAFTQDRPTNFAEGDNLTLPCVFSSPVPYKANYHWFKDGTPINDRSPIIKSTEDGSMLVIEDSTKSDSGEYTCEIDFIEWSEKIKPLSKTAKVNDFGGTSGKEALLASWTVIASVSAITMANML